MEETAELPVAESVNTFLGDETTNDLESDMTVCIAAICEKGNEVIFVRPFAYF
jgi:hypothetical protein